MSRFRILLLLAACAALAACAGAREAAASPPFARICEEDGYVATTWGWSICIEGHKMAWQEDPEKWEADRKSPPDPVRMRVLPPDKIPFSSHRRRAVPLPPDPAPPDPGIGQGSNSR